MQRNELAVWWRGRQRGVSVRLAAADSRRLEIPGLAWVVFICLVWVRPTG